jgi:heme/copper-type cytochrome/quinol oxidase subunit 2
MINMEIGKKLFIALVVIAVMAGAYGISLNITHPAHIQSSGPSGPVAITLVITTDNYYNSTIGQQPHYYLLQNGSLKSTTTITFPANQNITLTIICYDNGTAYPLGQAGNNIGDGAGQASLYDVNGTVGNVVKVINNTNVNSTSSKFSSGTVVSSFPQYSVSHTFTVAGLNLNIPIPPVSTVVADLHFSSSQEGTYSWQCNDPCGSGANGWEGAMATQGWMMGSVVVS